MSYNTLTKTEADDLLDSIHNFVLERYVQLRSLFDCDTRNWSVNVIQYLKDRDVRPFVQDIIATALTRHFCEGFDWVQAISEEFDEWADVIDDPKPVKTKTKTRKTTKKDIPMATNTNTNTQINVADLLKVKMMEKLMDGDTKDLNLGKMTVVQALANGQPVDFGEVMKAKMTEKLLKAVETDEDIPLGKLLMLQAMTTNPNFGINDLVQLKLMEKLLDEPEAKEKPKTK